MKEFDRTERIGAELKRELSEVLRDEVRDPRLADLTIHEVRVVKDLSHAKVYFTCLPTVAADTGISADADHGVAQTRLLNGRLAGFLRHALSQRVRLRTMPELHFVYDKSIGAGMHLSALIAAAVEGLADPDEAPDETPAETPDGNPAANQAERQADGNDAQTADSEDAMVPNPAPGTTREQPQ